jgi:hypothetical protein
MNPHNATYQKAGNNFFARYPVETGDVSGYQTVKPPLFVTKTAVPWLLNLYSTSLTFFMYTNSCWQHGNGVIMGRALG